MEKPTVYEDALERISQGATWKTDFKKRELWINGKRVDISENWGIPVYESWEELLYEIEDRYDAFKYSTPSEKSGKGARKSRFKALGEEDLVKELGRKNAYMGPNRELMRAELELFVLLSLANGSFRPEEVFAGKHFIQGAVKGLTMLREWFIA